MTIHNIKLSSSICNELISYTEMLDKQNISEETRGDRNGTSPFISNTKGGIRESTTVKDMNLFEDHREYLIVKHYENHLESGYTNYTSKYIDSCVPDNLLSHFRIHKDTCKIDVKKFMPGKIHIPHKDYYINFKYNLVDNNGTIGFIPKANNKNDTVIRLWITLTEPKFGHILIVENKTYYNLEQGTIVTWNANELHTAANLGFEARYIMTITGAVNVD